MKFEEIDEMVETLGPTLYRFCRRLTRNKPDADDLYQETFVKLVEGYDRIDNNGNPKSYLFSIAIYIWKGNCRKFARRQKIAPIVDMDDVQEQPDGSNIENEYFSKELYTLLSGEVDRLGYKFKLPLYLSYTVGMTTDEIAGVMKIPAGTVKSRLHKARKILKKRLEGFEYE